MRDLPNRLSPENTFGFLPVWRKRCVDDGGEDVMRSKRDFPQMLILNHFLSFEICIITLLQLLPVGFQTSCKEMMWGWGCDGVRVGMWRMARIFRFFSRTRSAEAQPPRPWRGRTAQIPPSSCCESLHRGLPRSSLINAMYNQGTQVTSWLKPWMMKYGNLWKIPIYLHFNFTWKSIRFYIAEILSPAQGLKIFIVVEIGRYFLRFCTVFCLCLTE